MASIISAGTTSGTALNMAGDTSGVLQLATNGSTTAVTINASQNVGIGTASPSAILQVNSTAATVRPIVTATTGYTDWVVANTGGNIYFGIDNSAGGVSGTAYGRHIYSDGAYPLDFFTNSTQRMRIDSSGNVLVTNPSGLGYGTGSGGTVTQATNKTTGVTLNKPVGQITTASSALGAGAIATFTVTNSVMAGTDVVIVNSQNINYSVRISDMAGGSFKITIQNESGGSLSQAVVIGFSIIKGAIS